MYLGCRFYPCVYVEFSRIPLEKSDLHVFPCAINCQTRVKASGDAMTGAGILAGDLVLLDRSRTPKDGDIVLAEVDGVSTMKYFRKRGSHVYLEAASPKYKPMVPQEQLTRSENETCKIPDESCMH